MLTYNIQKCHNLYIFNKKLFNFMKISRLKIIEEKWNVEHTKVYYVCCDGLNSKLYYYVRKMYHVYYKFQITNR